MIRGRQLTSEEEQNCLTRMLSDEWIEEGRSRLTKANSFFNDRIGM